ncbi:MAG: MFS transporter [Alphaproteobacteria bacterium]|nr:MFS transporter [Alphaproteobacteria bacterium]
MIDATRAADAAAAPRAARAQRATALIFVAHGLIIGSWAPHIPVAKAEAGVGPDGLGLILLCMALGAVAAMAFTGAAIARFGSGRVTAVATLAFCAAFILPVWAGTAVPLAAALLLFGITTGLMDVAMNAHAVDVEAALGRPAMSGFHGWFSVGAMLGAASGGVLLDLMSPLAHALALACGVAVLAAAQFRDLLPRAAGCEAGASGQFVRPSRASLLLGTLCLIAMMTEGAILDWSALHLTQEVGAAPGAAGLGYALLSVGMALSRFLGDRVRAALGSRATLRGSAAIGAVGLAAAVTTGRIEVAIAGYVLAGFGIGNLVPVLFSAAGALEPARPGHAIAAVTTLGYSGFLLGPPIVGALAAAIGLTAALALLAGGCLAIGLLAHRVGP